jgi:hypothetical protein
VKYAILADIHANLPALQAVLRDADQQGCTHYACLGDIVGYCWFPKECVDLIRRMNIPCVQGNHDLYCSAENSLDGFNPNGAEAIRWTHHQLSEDDRLWLGRLPLTLVIGGFTLVHATLDQPERWGYVFDNPKAAYVIYDLETQVIELRRLDYPIPEPPPDGPSCFLPKSPKGPRGSLTARQHEGEN